MTPTAYPSYCKGDERGIITIINILKGVFGINESFRQSHLIVRGEGGIIITTKSLKGIFVLQSPF